MGTIALENERTPADSRMKSTAHGRGLSSRGRNPSEALRPAWNLLATFVAVTGLAPLALGAEDRFRSEIRPILAQHCLACHGPDSQLSGLNLSSLEGLLSGGARHGPTIVPGHPEQSVLLRVLKGQLTPSMPMGSARLSDGKIRAIAKWVEQFEPTREKIDATAWSPFRAYSPPSPPEVSHESWTRNPIDRFILARLEAQGIDPAPEADRRLLARRLYFNLVGEPPTPDEIDAFLADAESSAYDRLVDKLLGDPRYGERWGRHWLDVTRYADTTGGEANREMYHVWRYRDYVIDAFNRDKPYDDFVKEQLAADEFAPTDPDKRVATAFLRLGAPPQSQIRRVARQQHLNEVTGTVGSVFLGLSLSCAQCHDHKYDPIPTRDFYRFQAFFLPIENINVDAEFTQEATREIASRGREAAERRLKRAREAYVALENRLLAKFRRVLKQEGEDPSSATPATLRARLTDAVANGVVPRDEPSFSMAEKVEYIRRLSFVDGFRGGRDMGVYRRQVERHLPKLHSVENARESPYSAGLPVQFVRVRGEVDNLGERVLPGYPSALTGTDGPASMPLDSLGNIGQWRLPLATWIASPDNPLTARVMVNRIWQRHFGRGIVATPSNFGANGIRPSHPHLLDWLASEIVASGWSVKAIHRLILKSATYRQSSVRFSERASDIDPSNTLLSRMPGRRLEGEVVRDSILAVSGRLNRARGGPGVYPRLPEAMKDQMLVKNWPAWEPSSGSDSRKKSVYVFQRRQLALPLLEMLDAPVPQVSLERRRTSTTAIQSLAMLNGRLVAEESQHFAARLKQEAGQDSRRRIRLAFRLAFSREPSEAELRRYNDFAKNEGLAAVCRILFNANEFVHVD